MKNFKSGQKVVFDAKGAVPIEDAVVPFKNGDIVIIYGKCKAHEACYYLQELPFSKSGLVQCCGDSWLHPIQPKTVTLSIHEIKLEPKKVLELETIYAQ